MIGARIRVHNKYLARKGSPANQLVTATQGGIDQQFSNSMFFGAHPLPTISADGYINHGSFSNQNLQCWPGAAGTCVSVLEADSPAPPNLTPASAAVGALPLGTRRHNAAARQAPPSAWRPASPAPPLPCRPRPAGPAPWMVESAGVTNRDLAWTQLAQKLGVHNIIYF